MSEDTLNVIEAQAFIAAAVVTVAFCGSFLILLVAGMFSR